MNNVCERGRVRGLQGERVCDLCCCHHGSCETDGAASLPAADGHAGSAPLRQLLLAT